MPWISTNSLPFFKVGDCSYIRASASATPARSAEKLSTFRDAALLQLVSRDADGAPPAFAT
jgi:hypothetical protein